MLTLALAAMLTFSASAATWINKSGNTPVANWTYYNFPTEYQTLQNNLSPGQSYWTSGCGVQFNRYYGDYANLLGTRGGLVHVVPTEEWWYSTWGNDAATARKTYAVTLSADPTGWPVDIYMNQQIQYSVINYNPLKEAIMPVTASFPEGFSTMNYRCLVAHEFGHSLGFYHPDEDPDISVKPKKSIMYQDKLSYGVLQEHDKERFAAKYG